MPDATFRTLLSEVRSALLYEIADEEGAANSYEPATLTRKYLGGFSDGLCMAIDRIDAARRP